MRNLYTHKGDIFGWADVNEKFLGHELDLLAGAAEGTSNIDLTWKEQLYPDYRAPIVRRTAEGRHEAIFSRWGLPSSKKALMDAATKRADRPHGGSAPVRNSNTALERTFSLPDARSATQPA